MGRRPIRKSGPMTATEHQRKWRRKVAREKKLANPRLVAKRERREAHLKALGEQQALAGKFGVIVADPPWPWEAYSAETGMDRSPDNHHATMTLEDIKALPVELIAADDAGLWLWATVPATARSPRGHGGVGLQICDPLRLGEGSHRRRLSELKPARGPASRRQRQFPGAGRERPQVVADRGPAP